MPPEDEYKTVYTELRLSSVDIWNPYTAVSRYDQGESGIADVIYKDSAYMEAHPEENMASVPELETKGLLCFNRNWKSTSRFALNRIRYPTRIL